MSTHNGQANLATTYAYNVRSWLKSSASPLFNQTLYYNDTYAGSTARYNGNISAMSWKISNESSTRGYKFAYDNLSQLTAADYLENGSTNDHFNTAYAYDKQGNMTSLSRRGNTGTTTYGNIDVLTMTYAGNQLVKAEDTGTTVSLSSSMDFKNGSRRMQAKICATVLAQLCHRTGTTLPTHWHNRAIAVAQTYSFYSGKSLFVLP